HDHVIKLLATWRRGDKWSMLFPWAKSNLKNYWNQNPPQRSPGFVQWILSQCRGLAEGLQKIHRSPSEHAKDFGIHEDIKPENILLFDSQSKAYGILVISDFGYTRFHGRSTRSNTLIVGTSPTYKAPEADLGKTIARSYDMWSFGCVLLEFITWYLRGPAGIRDFIDRRNEDDERLIPGCSLDKFFNINREDGLKDKPEVKGSWISELGLDTHCSDYLKELLALIVTELLQPDPKSR
ncbi:kinase-like domain-containing protein, partial [Colletotrichum lupini]